MCSRLGGCGRRCPGGGGCEGGRGCARLQLVDLLDALGRGEDVENDVDAAVEVGHRRALRRLGRDAHRVEVAEARLRAARLEGERVEHPHLRRVRAEGEAQLLGRVHLRRAVPLEVLLEGGGGPRAGNAVADRLGELHLDDGALARRGFARVELEQLAELEAVALGLLDEAAHAGRLAEDGHQRLEVVRVLRVDEQRLRVEVAAALVGHRVERRHLGPSASAALGVDLLEPLEAGRRRVEHRVRADGLVIHEVDGCSAIHGEDGLHHHAAELAERDEPPFANAPKSVLVKETEYLRLVARVGDHEAIGSGRPER